MLETYSTRKTFPVTKVARIIEDKGVSVAKHGEGTKIASTEIMLASELAQTSISPLMEDQGTTAEQRDKAKRTRAMIEKGLKWLARYKDALKALPSSLDKSVPVHFLEGHDVVLDTADSILRFDTDTVVEASPLRAQARRVDGDLSVLYGLGLFHEFQHLAGLDEKACLDRTLTFYEHMSEADKAALTEILSVPTLDTDKVFLRFLREGAGKPQEEKDRLIAWLRARTQIELPYNSHRVRRAIEQETEDLAALRMAIYNAIHDTYVEEVDTAHSIRVADWCLENDIRLVGGRFSRAFYLDAMLMASAKLLPGRALQESIRAFEEEFKSTTFDFENETLKNRDFSFEALGGEAQTVINLTAKDKVSSAEIEGALTAFKKALRGFEASIMEEIDQIQTAESALIASERRKTRGGEGETRRGGDAFHPLTPSPPLPIGEEERGGESLAWNRLVHDRGEVKRKVETITLSLSRIEGAVVDAPKFDPAFMAYFQRIFPLDAINMGILNELKDPFFGEDENVHRLIRECGHRMYVTSNLKAWLTKCNDWIEALPAYATYQIIPKEGGGYDIMAWVQRAILEDMYRRHAEDWALNIEEVMASEHVALARDLLIEQNGLTQEADRKAEEEDIPREEAVRQIAIEKGWADEIADLAARIEAVYNDHCIAVARIRQDNDLSRMEALRRFLKAESFTAEHTESAENTENKNLAVLSGLGGLGGEKRQSSLRAIALKKRRPLPNIHVLTTLGPGESEINVQNWLEETMGLFNVSRAYGLEKEVEARIEAYQTRIIAVGRKIVEELDLEGDLYNLMEEEGFRTESEEDRDQGILRLIASYPEVSEEVTRLALILDYEEHHGLRAQDPSNTEEPKSVLDTLKAHPEIETEAVRKVIVNNELEAEDDEAARELVAGNEAYAAEQVSIARSEARRMVVEELGWTGEVRGYMRAHLDPMIAKVGARRELIAEHKLSAELSNPRFRYDATGPFKKYNLLYTPSRVDLGAEEVHSVRNVPKWIGGLDRDAANAGKSLYSLYNVAGPTAVDSPRLAEFLKVGENFFSRGGVYYLSLAAGANLDALGIGDFEFFRDQWNMRGDRMVLPTGETYGGFCVPKEFSLLYAIIIAAVRKETRGETLDGFGVPRALHDQVIGDLRRALAMELDCADQLEWEMKATEFLTGKYEEYFGVLGQPAYLARLPQLAKTLEKQGVLFARDEEQRQKDFRLAYWINKKAQGLEEINRAGPFRKVSMIRQLVNEARRENPNVAPEDKLIGMMGAPYKEGERHGDREIPITDVRFSAGARKLEIYAGTMDHLLRDIDPEGREIIGEMFRDFRAPADIRMVGTCTGPDILNHVPGSGSESMAEDVYRRLQEVGLDDELIDANCTVHGGDLGQWSGIKELPEDERTALVAEIGGKIHLLVLARRGPYRTYEEAVQGVDFVDLSIPDPELLDLVDDLPKLLYLMRKGRPNSALVLADGTSGGRRRAFSYRYASSKRKTKEWFALDDRAVYGCLGLGRATLEQWRREMITERTQAKDLWDALMEGDTEKAQEVYGRILARIIREESAEEAAKEEIAAHKAKAEPKPYRILSDVLGRVKRGLALHQLDFGTWLILGGSHVFNGKLTEAEIADKRAAFEQAIADCEGRRAKGEGRRAEGDPKSDGNPKSEPVPAFDSEDVDYIVATFLRPRYVPPPEGLYQEMETGIAGSLKAAEEQVSRLEKREARRRQARRASGLQIRRRAFMDIESEVAQAIEAGDFTAVYNQAKGLLGDGHSSISQETFGAYLGWTKAAFVLLTDDLLEGDSVRSAGIRTQLDAFFTGGELDQDAYRSLEAEFARMAELVGGDRDRLEHVAMALELLDIALIVEKTQDVEHPDETMIQIAQFFDVTLNNHIFDYIPYHYHQERGVGFEGLDRQEKFELSARRHRWLYTYIRSLMAERTKLADLGAAYPDAWLGDADRDLLPLGVRADDPAQRFWFSYARLRDASVLVHEGYPLPELFQNLDPSAIHADERPNVVIVYPHGNTTVPVAMEQGAKLSEREGINLMLSAFPTIVDDGRYGRKVLHVHDGFMYVSRADYRTALVASGMDEATADDKAAQVTDEGILIAAAFSRPVVAHGIFFHFTHPLRPDISTVQVPLIQPFLWEAATHLKCRLPDMLQGSGTRTADQINWYEVDATKLSGTEAKARIEADLSAFAETHDTLIVKPEKESGGRKAMILPVRQNGRLLSENIAALRDLVYDICKTDNAVIQDVLQSRVRQLYTREFLEDLVDRFARIGIPVLLDRDPRTPLFSYFRQILVLGKKGYEISHHITVVSTRGIANVGQGGLLYEYTDDIIHPKYREDLRREITKAAYGSMEAQRKYIKAHWQEILEEYLSAHPEYAGQVRMEIGEDLTGFSDADIPYEMGDYMPVFLVDEQDHLIQLYDEDTEQFLPLFDEEGKPNEAAVYDADGTPIPRTDEAGHALPIPMFDAEGHRIARFDAKGRPISTLVALKIEPNPGAGLWRPHNDQLPPERKGEGVYTIFRCLGERAAMVREKLAELAQAPVSTPTQAIYLSSTETEKALDALDEAMRKARVELGR